MKRPANFLAYCPVCHESVGAETSTGALAWTEMHADTVHADDHEGVVFEVVQLDRDDPASRQFDEQ